MPNVNYVPSAIVYLTLLVPWATAPTAEAPPAPAERRWVVVRAAIALAYGGAALTHTEFWPVTSVPMFSHLRDAGWVRACLKPFYTAGRITSREDFKHLARELTRKLHRDAKERVWNERMEAKVRKYVDRAFAGAFVYERGKERAGGEGGGGGS